MRIAQLIDKDAVGGGNAYIRLLQEGLPDVETRVFYANRGECRAGVVDAWKPDVIHANHLRSLLQLFFPRRPSAPVAFTVHGVHVRKYDHLPKTPKNRVARFLRVRLERWLYRKCACLIVLTESDAEFVRATYGADLPLEVIPNGI